MVITKFARMRFGITKSPDRSTARSKYALVIKRWRTLKAAKFPYSMTHVYRLSPFGFFLVGEESPATVHERAGQVDQVLLCGRPSGAVNRGMNDPHRFRTCCFSGAKLNATEYSIHSLTTMLPINLLHAPLSPEGPGLFLPTSTSLSKIRQWPLDRYKRHANLPTLSASHYRRELSS
jgi:hypothetical protein